MLDKELARIVDIKEKTDQKLIEAHKQLSEFEYYKNKTTALMVFILTKKICMNLINFIGWFFRSNWKVKIK